jgi:hypothetical protein
MTGDDMHQELEQLRAEVATLSAARESKQAAGAQPETSPIEPQASDTGDVNGIIEQAREAVEGDAELKGQFDQLFEHLEQEIKDLPAITTLAVFSLGVLFGRLLR